MTSLRRLRIATRLNLLIALFVAALGVLGLVGVAQISAGVAAQEQLNHASAPQVKELAGETARATNDISGRIEQIQAETAAAAGTGEISRNIHGVAEAAGVTDRSVAESRAATAELAAMSAKLQDLVGRFTV